MVTGVGIDIIDLSRVRQIWQRHAGRLENDLLTECEYEQFCSIVGEESVSEIAVADRATRFLASRWTVKEATVKVLGAPHLMAFNWCDIEVAGELQVQISVAGELRRLAMSAMCTQLIGSVHSDSRFCVALVIGETE